MEEWKNAKSRWELLDNAPDYAEATAEMLNWVDKDPTDPVHKGVLDVYCALIGWSEEKITINPMDSVPMGYLAEALNEYAGNEDAVWEYVETYFQWTF